MLAAFDRRRTRRRRRRASSTSCSARSRRRCSSTASRSSTARTGTTNLTGIADFLAQNTLLHDGVLLARHRVPARRPRLQGRGRAVPHVDARRVPGRADAGHRVHGRRHEGRRVRGAAARLRRRVPALQRRLAPDRSFGLAVLSLLVGSVAAVVQTDVKRMLAYSSISHAGYVLIGGAGRDREGHERRAVLRADLRGDDHGAFAVVAVVARQRRRRARAHRLPRTRRAPAAARRRCSRCSCSRRPACRSPAGSWPSSPCSAPRSTRGQYWLALIGMLAAVDRGIRLPAHHPHDVRAGRRRRRSRARPRIRVDAAPASRSRSRPPRSCSSAIVPGVMLDFAKHATQLLAR